MTDAAPRANGDRTPSLAEDPALGLSQRAKIEILGAIMLGLFLGALDQTVVGTALPRIVTDLGGNDLYTWVVTIYLLTSTITVPFYGKLSDLYGRRPLLMIGISLFLIGSALSGLSQAMWQLILFRGIQGLGAGALFPISLAVIGDLFTPAERGKYQGLFGAVFGIAALVGPWLGGFLTESISWHWVFIVNLPVGAVALLIIWRLLPTLKREGARPSIDYVGVATFTAGLVPILIGLTNAQRGDWSDVGVWGWIVGGLVFLIVFLAVEARAREPIVPLDLFRNRTFSLSMLAVFTASFGFFGAIIFLPIWFQVVAGATPTQSGYYLLPFLAGLILSSVASGQIISRTGRYKWITAGALGLVVVGLVLFTNLRATTPFPILWAWMFVTGLGIGPSLAAYTIIVQNAVPMQKLGAATSDLTLFRQVGGTVGLTFGFTLFRSGLGTELPTQLLAAGVPRQVLERFPTGALQASDLTSVGGGGMGFLQLVPEALREPIVNGIHQAISIAIADSFWLGVGASLAAVIATLLLVELPLRTTFGHAPEEGQGHEGTATARLGAPAAD